MTARHPPHPAPAPAHPGARQMLASDPLKSVWVGASAGTGKTKVLTDRVLRLMLPRAGLPRESATPPGRILCLTFTKTAAAEMSNRIYERLGQWAVMDGAELRRRLEELTGAAPSPEMEEEARRLFARVLDVPGGLKIMTIHSFCQSVLKRFPVEAGLPPHFQMMDEQSAIEYLKECQHRVIAEAKGDPGSAMAGAFSLLTLHLDAEAMSELMRQVMARRSLLGEILERHGDAEGAAERTVAGIYRYLGVAEGASGEEILARAAALPGPNEARLKKALGALLQGGADDREAAALMQPWLEQKERRAELFDAYCSAYFTDKGEIRKRLATKRVVEVCPDVLEVMQAEAERIDGLKKELRALRLAQFSAALLRLAAAMVGHYARHKRYRDMLDFDDLILKVCALLAEEGMAPWVLFKLDEGIDHILVDEAQDTSRHQWQVIESLSAEFFAGRGAKEDALRTLFVVGDEKQSIFSFQGADPAEFARMREFFGGRVAALQDGWEVFLEHSFRSTRSVLEVVDRVFSNALARRGVAAREVLHLPFRARQAGLVELWPLVSTGRKGKAAPWQPPTEVDAGDNAAARLAQQIAATVRGWIDKKEMLPSKGRPIRAGDVLVLVQSRGAFVELLIRALKGAAVPVAGVDRLVLTGEIAVMDLLALAQFALLPADDLTLATLLKSPLVGLDEDGLYRLCRGRPSSLWAAVKEQKPALAAWLQGRVAQAGSATPYEFFAEALSAPCFADAVSGRRAFYGRLGPEIRDALDEFLNRCLHYEQSHTPSLQKFVDWFSRGEAEIKREQDHAGADQVRIMTVHGAKGLQAPIVFLPDAAKRPHDHKRPRLLWPEGADGVPLWSPRKEFDAAAYAALQHQAQERQEEEYRRLLYVALTRAEDRLYVCGYHGAKASRPDCWYGLVADAFPPDAEKIGCGTDAEGQPLFIRRLSHPQEDAPETEKAQAAQAAALHAPLPEWCWRPPANEPSPPRPLAPSRPDDAEPAGKSPLAADEGWKFGRGIVAHRLLEILPQLPPAQWEKTLAHYLAQPRLQIPLSQQKSFAGEILAVLRHPGFAPIFGPGSRAEVPVVGMAGKKVLSGQIDRLLVTDERVLVVDYKTNRPPPRRAEDVPPIYLRQMAAYRAVIHNIYPGREVSCALLWTDGPLLMPLPDEVLDSYIP